MERQTEFTFTMGSDSLKPSQWRKLQTLLSELVSRDFGGCRFVTGAGAWREGADNPAGSYPGQLHYDDTLTLIVTVPETAADPSFGLIQSSIAAAIRHLNLGEYLDWIDTTERTVTARHWQASKFFATEAA